jgi:hypothetical protein
MLSWLRRRKAAERIEPRPTRLSASQASRPVPKRVEGTIESSGDAIALWWCRGALAVAHKTGERIGLDTSNRMAMNAVFAPDRKPQPLSRVDELKGCSRPKAISAPVYQLGARSPTFNCDRTRD